jgi:hypothetical protein
MSEFRDFTEFMGRAGCLYGKSNLCPPFHLKEFAESWFLEGISLAHCVDQIASYLAQHSGRHRSGSGDGSLAFLDYAIRQSWSDKLRPPRAKPARTDRYHQRIGEAHRPVDGSSCEPIPSPNFAPPVRPQRPLPPPQKPLDRAIDFLKQELADGEVAAVKVEEAAKDEGIALRTLDRARKELMVISRRTGFGKTGRSWLSLPTAPTDPRASPSSTFSN